VQPIRRRRGFTLVELPAVSGRKRAAFTLVELLAVVGIIALLIGLLMPVLSKARRQALQVACLSNLRQLGLALISYASENGGRFPGCASGLQAQDEDWVYWQEGRDPSAGRLWRHLGGHLDVLKCPLGVPERPPDQQPPYPFSYSVNTKITGIDPPIVGPMPPRTGCKLGAIRMATVKMLAVEEDSATISDGAWYVDTPKFWMGNKMIYISVRHDRDGREYSRLPDDWSADRGRGNVVFADGHGEFTDRRRAMAPLDYEPLYDGPPPPDWPWY
jgi:prepilin-type processing-associated H-X9-DG protein